MSSLVADIAIDLMIETAECASAERGRMGNSRPMRPPRGLLFNNVNVNVQRLSRWHAGRGGLATLGQERFCFPPRRPRPGPGLGPGPAHTKESNGRIPMRIFEQMTP